MSTGLSAKVGERLSIKIAVDFSQGLGKRKLSYIKPYKFFNLQSAVFDWVTFAYSDEEDTGNFFRGK